MASPAETAAMRRALELAATDDVPLGPNPRVGCVLLDADGRRRRRGLPPRRRHAARRGRRAGRAPATAARGATAVVTLEPCNHTGRTGPCAEALIAAGVAPGRLRPGRPQPGRGRRRRRAARGRRRRRGRPARRRGGRRSTRRGRSPMRARPAVRHLEVRRDPRRPRRRRRRHQPVDHRAAGPRRRAPRCARTVRRDRGRHRHRARRRPAADRPRRGSDGADLPRDRQPLRVVVGHAAAARRPPGCSTTPRRRCVLRHPRPRGGARRPCTRASVQHVLLEGGPTLAGAFVAAGLVDEVVAYVAPGPARRRAAAPGDAGITTIADGVAAADRWTSRALGRRRPASPRVPTHGGGLRCSPASSRSSARSWRSSRRSDAVRLTVRGPLVVADASHGDSIAVNGVLPDRRRARRRRPSPPTSCRRR